MISRVITKEEWKNILNTMEFYSRTSGFVYLVDDKLTFFDADPNIDGIGACFVTIDNVREWSELDIKNN